jgi:hypothetical protein
MLRVLYPQRSHNDERIVGYVNKSIVQKITADLESVTNLTVWNAIGTRSSSRKTRNLLYAMTENCFTIALRATRR